MKFKIWIPALTLGTLLLSCQQSSKSGNDAADTTTVYQPSGDTSTAGGDTDTAIDKGMGDTAGVQGGTKVNVGTDTAGKQ